MNVFHLVCHFVTNYHSEKKKALSRQMLVHQHKAGHGYGYKTYINSYKNHYVMSVPVTVMDYTCNHPQLIT